MNNFCRKKNSWISGLLGSLKYLLKILCLPKIYMYILFWRAAKLRVTEQSFTLPFTPFFLIFLFIFVAHTLSPPTSVCGSVRTFVRFYLSSSLKWIHKWMNGRGRATADCRLLLCSVLLYVWDDFVGIHMCLCVQAGGSYLRRVLSAHKINGGRWRFYGILSLEKH